MLVVGAIANIGRTHFVEVKSIRQTCRKLCLSRNTMRQVRPDASRREHRAGLHPKR